MRAVDEVAQNPGAILTVLALVALAASMVLAQEATTTARAKITEAAGESYPSGVFRAPHPAILAPGGASSGD